MFRFQSAVPRKEFLHNSVAGLIVSFYHICGEKEKISLNEQQTDFIQLFLMEYEHDILHRYNTMHIFATLLKQMKNKVTDIHQCVKVYKDISKTS